MTIIQFIAVQFVFIITLSQQPNGQQQKQHNIKTQITKDNKQDTYENKTQKTNKRTKKNA